MKVNLTVSLVFSCLSLISIPSFGSGMSANSAVAEVTCGIYQLTLLEDGTVKQEWPNDVIVLAGITYNSWYSSGSQDRSITIVNGQEFSDAYVEFGGAYSRYFNLDFGVKEVFIFNKGNLEGAESLSVSYNPDSGQFTTVKSNSPCIYKAL